MAGVILGDRARRRNEQTKIAIAGIVCSGVGMTVSIISVLSLYMMFAKPW